MRAIFDFMVDQGESGVVILVVVVVAVFAVFTFW